MCLFVGTYHNTCKHTCFELYLFCDELLHQLNRINDKTERDKYLLPFDADCSGCSPYTNLIGEILPLGLDGRPLQGQEQINVVKWVMDMMDYCPGCAGAW
ncbi:uncharacterized protein N7511_010243 [Penicillium nucicola]|uniref:uncharacterized protein n=1 Tax=Penicillium nucicola TaxID=1850975 RepID=UPI002544D339|nr:uncharacterized protein N7511_010243 [Penicillium nucicola]KAJ5748547.1 hypothetical protein N7511_010243 [Penicillium nucicola]